MKKLLLTLLLIPQLALADRSFYSSYSLISGATTGSFGPTVTDTYDIGSAALAYSNVYANNVRSGTGSGLFLRATSSNISLYTGGLNRWEVDTSGNLLQNATNGGDVVFAKAATGTVRQNTSDATDNQSITIAGGGTSATTRGVSAAFYGNEGSVPGSLVIDTGNVSTASILNRINGTAGQWDVRAANNVLWSITYGGVLTQNNTNGSDLWMPKTATGLILGASSATRDTDITASVSSSPILTVNDNSANIAITTVGTGNNTTGSGLWGLKTRSTSGTGDANTIVQSGDGLFSIQAAGADGASYRRAASINFEVDGTPGASDMPGRIAFQTTADGAASPVLRWTMNNSGQIVQDATNGGQIILSRTAGNLQGIIAGATSLDSSLTAVTGNKPGLVVNQNRTLSDGVILHANAADTLANVITFSKTRATAPSTAGTTIVANGDELGVIRFLGANGTSYNQGALIKATVNGTPGAVTDMPGKLEFYTTPDGSGSPTLAMALDRDQGTTLTGQLFSTRTSDLGWTPVNAANQACNTTCTSACVFGMNTGALGNFVGCADATADTCICAGAS